MSVSKKGLGHASVSPRQSERARMIEMHSRRTSDLRAPMLLEQKTGFLNWMHDVQILHVYYMKHKAGFLNRDARCRNSVCVRTHITRD